VGHLRASGFEVREENVVDLAPVKRRLQVPAALQSCHTAVIGDYVVEGHVPADLIQRLLRERPAVLGLAVPGMPVGAPGLGTPGRAAQRYDVLTFDRSGRTTVFARR
jgi:hypothetical protein